MLTLQNIKKILFALILLTNLTATSQHYETNIVVKPCDKFHYYGVAASGEMHYMGEQCCYCYEPSIVRPDPRFISVFRSKDGATCVWQVGPRSLTPSARVVPSSPRIMPTMPPLRVSITNRFPIKSSIVVPTSQTTVPSSTITGVLTDTNPPVITNFQVRESLMMDQKTVVPTQVKFVHGPVADNHTGQIVTNAIVMTFQASANHCYVVWCSSNLKANIWLEYPITNICPIPTDSIINLVLPILSTGQRFYQLRST